MYFEIDKLLEGKFYASLSPARRGMSGIIKYAIKREDMNFSCDSVPYTVQVSPAFAPVRVSITGESLNPFPPLEDFYATVYVEKH